MIERCDAIDKRRGQGLQLNQFRAASAFKDFSQNKEFKRMSHLSTAEILTTMGCSNVRGLNSFKNVPNNRFLQDF